ncbi:flagellar protein FlaG protein [Hydrogenovibrio crunogenus]|uniref:Flagellar protein FlaG protein n=1 Tax=Hydrogenovibrio crunogenus TaxID=39765 RepID=A0A4P7P030_9GAMM|nr:flagellar protein FlaG [Hydrogenovibrio crunogenus]QBZ83480.1 flagellar protein FlaG protein [Hydrogenovibrio crunogenus]
MDIKNHLPPDVALNMQPETSHQVATISKSPQQASTLTTSALTKNADKIAIDDIQSQATSLNEKMLLVGLSLAFSVDEGTQSSVVTVLDTKTNEVVKQLPSEGSLKMMKNIQDYLDNLQRNEFKDKESLTGVLFNEII